MVSARSLVYKPLFLLHKDFGVYMRRGSISVMVFMHPQIQAIHVLVVQAFLWYYIMFHEIAAEPDNKYNKDKLHLIVCSESFPGIVCLKSTCSEWGSESIHLLAVQTNQCLVPPHRIYHVMLPGSGPNRVHNIPIVLVAEIERKHMQNKMMFWEVVGMEKEQEWMLILRAL